MSNEIAIIRKENVETIVSIAPNAFSENQVSHDRCLDAGAALLATIRENGMNDELDLKASVFIEKARKTLGKMNEKRSPVTKLFDEIRRQFTSLENDVDPAKRDTVPFQLQQLRNEYAAKKRAEEERRQRELIIRQQRIAAINQCRSNVEQDYRSTFNNHLNSAINRIIDTYNRTTLDNYDSAMQSIHTTKDILDESIFSVSHAFLPNGIGVDELAAIRQEVLDGLLPTLRSLYTNNIEKVKNEYKQLMPSKKSELERIEKASAEEAERIKREMAEREALEAAQIAKENQEREEKERLAQQATASATELNDLFAASSVGMPAYQAKTSVKKKIRVTGADGFLQLFSLWWSEEGASLPIETLMKEFKKQVTFCEKLANRKENAITLNHPDVIYEEEVKAK